MAGAVEVELIAEPGLTNLLREVVRKALRFGYLEDPNRLMSQIFVVNLRAARVVGLTCPPSVLLRVDHVVA